VSGRPISACIVCYNNETTLADTIRSLQSQTVRVDDLVVVDDGSIDGSAAVAASLGARVISHSMNLGRGGARARAMNEVMHDLVLCCDATNVLQPSFVENALGWFDDPKVAAVFGRITQAPAATLAERWRGRHLFKVHLAHEPGRRMLLCTWGTLVRASAVRSVGGYNRHLRHTEDGDLGERLLAADFDVVYDPALEVKSIAVNTLHEVLERHWRWHAGVHPSAGWREYRKSIAHSIKCMAKDDLLAGDLLSVPVSLLCPHYHFVRSLRRG
jgi:glycosyltransferase involved in cell wall biosynthesis